MKICFTFLILLIGSGFVNAQTSKVAILDFENTSGKVEYDALSKAISNMLITDLANNIHPKKVEFFERSQLNKLLDEQKLQKSKNFDTKTAVNFGKLSGVNYVFVGSVFVLDGMCNFSSKLVEVQTSKILLAKDVSGKIETWLQLKTQLAEAIAIQLNNPITLDPLYKDQSTSFTTINQYGKILTTMDVGDIENAEQMRGVFEDTNPEFKYFKDLKDDIEELKKQVAKNTKDIKALQKTDTLQNMKINSLEKGGGKIINANSFTELVSNLLNNMTSDDEQYLIIEELLTNYPIETKKKFTNNFFMAPILSFSKIDELEFNKILDRAINYSKIKSNEIVCKYYLVKILYLLKYYLAYSNPNPSSWNKVEIVNKFNDFLYLLKFDSVEIKCYRFYFNSFMSKYSDNSIEQKIKNDGISCDLSEVECLKIFY